MFFLSLIFPAYTQHLKKRYSLKNKHPHKLSKKSDLIEFLEYSVDFKAIQ